MKGKVSISIAAVLVLITAGFVWYGKQPVAPKESTWDDVLTEATNGGYQLVTTEELRDHYQNDPESILFVDTRQEWEYRTGHIETAVNFPMEPTWWSRWRRSGDLEDFLGSNKEVMLVFY